MSADITDPALLEMLGDASRNISVLVELDIPEPQVELIPDARSPGQQRIKAVIPRTDTEQEELDEMISLATRYLVELVGEEPVALPAAHALVTRVSGAQLEQLAEQPFVREIRLNRKV